MKTKNISTYLLISLILVSCVETPKAISTKTAIPTITLTSLPTETPLTPSATPDPNAPEGWTKYENGKYYLDKNENGKTITYIWNPSFEEWVISLTTIEGITILDWADNAMEGYEKDIGHIDVIVSIKAPGVSNLSFNLIHTNKNLAQMNDQDLTARAGVTFFKRVYGKGTPTGTEMWQFDLALQKGIAIDYFIGDLSNTKSIVLDPDFRTMVLVTDWESLIGASEFSTPYGLVRAETLGVDDKGILLGKIAMENSVDTFTKEQWWLVTLLHASNLIDTQDQTYLSFNETLNSWLAFADNKSTETGEYWIMQFPNK